MKTTEPKVNPKHQKPYQPALGREFPVEDAVTIEAKSRGFVTRIIVWSLVAAMFCAAVLSLYTGSYTPLAVTWSIAGPISGSVIGYYFNDRKDKG